MKSSLADKKLTSSEPEDNNLLAANKEELRESSDTYKCFDCLSYGQLFRYNIFSLMTYYDYQEDTLKSIYLNEEPSVRYRFN